jgi:hypothetical protein
MKRYLLLILGFVCFHFHVLVLNYKHMKDKHACWHVRTQASVDSGSMNSLHWFMQIGQLSSSLRALYSINFSQIIVYMLLFLLVHIHLDQVPHIPNFHSRDSNHFYVFNFVFCYFDFFELF